MEHELKTDAKVFEAVKLGEKTFEIRKDDRAYAVGDLLILRKAAVLAERLRSATGP